MSDTDSSPRDDLIVVLMERLEQQERRIAGLERSLHDARAREAVPHIVVDDAGRPSRRGLILGAAAAAAAATVARSTPVAADADVTIAGASSTLFGVYASPDGVSRPALPADARVGVLGRAEASAAAFGVSAPVGVMGTADTGYGVIGQTNSGFAAVGGFAFGTEIAVYGSANSGQGVHGLSASGDGVFGVSTSGTGVAAGSTSGFGLAASSSTSAAVRGISQSGVGAQFNGGAGALLLFSNRPAPATRTVAAARSTIDPDTDGSLWVCVAAGTPGTWRKLAGPGTAGAFHALTPGRVYDSRLANPAGSVGVLESGQSRTISVADRRNLVTGAVDLAGFVPAGATALTANVGVVDTIGSGFVAVNPGGISVVSAASINWFASGQILNNGQNLTLNSTGEVTIVAGGGGSTHVVIDVTGYYL